MVSLILMHSPSDRNAYFKEDRVIYRVNSCVTTPIPVPFITSLQKKMTWQHGLPGHFMQKQVKVRKML